MSEGAQGVGDHPSTRRTGGPALSIHRTFVVRLYPAPADDGSGRAGALAGRVEHVPTRQEATFSTVEELVAFFRSREPASEGDGPCR